MPTPNTGIPYVPEGTQDPAAGLNLSLNVIDALLQTAVIDMDLTAPPGSPSDGDLHIVAAVATGAWAGEDNNLARYVAEGASWQFYEAGVNVFLILNKDDGALYAWDGAAWSAPIAGGGGAVDSVVAGTGIDVDVTDPANPEVSLEDTAVTPGSYTNADITVDAQGRITAAANGSGGGGGSAPLSTISGTTYTVAAADDGAYLRFTNTAAKTVTIDPDATTALPTDGEWFIRNHGTNDLTISPGGGVTVNLPSGGSLVVGTGGACVLKRVATDTFDLL